MYTFTTLAILVVAIGLNTAVFSVANVLLLKPWSLPAPHELIRAFHVRPKGDVVNVSFVESRYLSERARSVDLVTSREAAELVLDGSKPGGANIRGDFVSGNYFSALHLPLALGRGFMPDEINLAAPSSSSCCRTPSGNQAWGPIRTSLVKPLGSMDSAFRSSA